MKQTCTDVRQFDTNSLLVSSCNRPKLSPFAKWSTDAVDFADIGGPGKMPHGIVVDTNDYVYVGPKYFNLIQIWSPSGLLVRNLTVSSSSPSGIAVTRYGDVLIDAHEDGQIEKFTPSSVVGILTAVTPSACFDLFIDTNNTVYCSVTLQDSVVSIVLDSNGSISGNIVNKIAGIGGRGGAADMLSTPRGLFVDEIYQLYVADCDNHRIQSFPLGQTNAITVAGNGAPGTTDLTCPNDVVKDGNGHLFILDAFYHRIVASGPNGFRCVAACSGVGGVAPNQLDLPLSMAFDSHGNIFVADRSNYMVRKFLLINDTNGRHFLFSFFFFPYIELFFPDRRTVS